MITNQLGNTDIHLSAIGLGAWAIGGGDYKFGWGFQDDKDSIATIRHALELGINWIDTAPVYGSGHSEKIVGKAINEIRENVILSTKCGLQMAENREDIIFRLKKNNIRSELESSLKRLQTEIIDLYMIHKPIPEEDIEEAWNVLIDMKREGKIRYAGVSSFTLEQLKRIHSIHPAAFIQNEYSMLQFSIEHEILDYCIANHIGVLVYSPMASGLLTGKYTKEKVERLPADDWRSKSSPFFHSPYFQSNLKLVERLKSLAEKTNRTVAQLAIAWVLRRPEVTSAIVGARKPSQIEQTAPAGDWVLSEEDQIELDKILKEHRSHSQELRTQTKDSD